MRAHVEFGLAITGWILAVVQFLYWLKDRGAREARYAHLRATRDQVRDLQGKLEVAIGMPEIFGGAGERLWLTTLLTDVRAIETHLGAVMGGTSAPKKRQP